MTILYTAVATTIGGRDGHTRSDDGLIDLDVATPRALGGSGAVGTNPEQLYAAAYSACFGGAIDWVARKQKLITGKVAITARVSFCREEGGAKLAVELIGRFPELAHADAMALMAAAHQVCPQSRANRGNVDVTLTVDDGAPEAA
jgi:osmotically inducible protein OsmC